MKIEVDLDRLEDFIFWIEPPCSQCYIRFDTNIDCPYKSGIMAKFRCSRAIIEYLKGK